MPRRFDYLTQRRQGAKMMPRQKVRRQEAVSKPAIIYDYSVKTLEELLEDGAAM
jgi:hypothetical protein